MKRNQTLYLTLAALFLALGIVLPFLTANNMMLGNMLSLMHIPVLLCGFVCGWSYGLLIGFITPLLRSVLIGAPPMMPVAIMMAFELAAYGALAGLLYKALPKTIPGLYAALILSMLIGRAVWGLTGFALYSLAQDSYARVIPVPFSLKYFWNAAFLTPWPGIALQIGLIPPILLALGESKLFPLKG